MYEHPREIINLNFETNNNNLESSKLIFIKAKFNNKNIKVLIDTASEGSLINENLVDYNNDNLGKNNIIKIPAITLLGANNKKITKVSKAFTDKIHIGDQQYDMHLLIVENIEVDIIFGTDMLDKYKAKINYENHTIRLNGQEINFEEFECENEEKKNNNNEDNIKENKNMRYLNMNYYDEDLYENKMKINNDCEVLYEEINKEDYEEIRKENSRRDYEEKKKLMEIEIKCPEKYRKDVNNLFSEHYELFSKENRIARKYIHHIEVKNIEAFRKKSYPIPYHYRNQVNAELQNMVKAGIIERADTVYINPVVIVKKSSGELRICLDARNINQCSVPQYESPISIDSIMGRITNATIFTKLDLKHSFWLIPLDKSSRKYTGFQIDGVVYQFCVIPFGIQSASAGLVRSIHGILDKYDDFVVHYIDDILIFSKDPQEHQRHLKIVVRELDEAGLKLNIGKCEFYQESVKYLGFQINIQGIEMDPDRIKTILEYGRPHNLRTLRGFLGMTHYYKRLIPDLSSKEISLIQLLKKGEKWRWTEEREKSFQDIKQSFMNKLKNFHPDYNYPFILRTDASVQRFSGVLLQNIDGDERPVYFISRITKPHEQKYSVSELELASIIYCVTKLRFYLLGNHFVIETDHSALTSILKNKYGNSRIHRWSLLLQEYTFEIRHLSGKKNIVADVLSRMEGERKISRQIKIGMNIMKEEYGLFSNQEIKEDQKKLNLEDYKKYTIQDEFILKIINGEELFIVSQELSKRILKKLHELFGHIGSRKLWKMYRENYYNLHDLSLAKIVTTTCELCQKAKEKNFKNYNMPRSIICEEKNHKVAIDFISNLPETKNNYKHILVVTDVFSKFTKLYPCKKTNVRTVKRCLNNYREKVGTFKECLLDNATYFNNDKLKQYCRDKNITLSYISIRHPQSNPSERYIKEIIKFLRILCANERHELWENHLSEVETFINSTYNSTTEEIPERIMFNTVENRPWILENNKTYEDILNKVNKNIKRQAEKYCKRQKKKIQKTKTFKKGDLVLVRARRKTDWRKNQCEKFLLPFEGPYLIDTDNGINSYKLKELKTNKERGIFHINDLYEFKVNI
jgi:RNase H-like domain found in reverse transcriptase/Reverse transcriptase (RNA-dependent DNA polymerase)/Integrase zinc binding domain/Aspartyl protease